MNNENNLLDLQRHNAVQDARISNLETKFEMFMQSVKETTENLKSEMKDFKAEMRDRDNRRAAENEEIRQSIKEIYQTTDAKITDIKNTIDSTNKHIQNFSIAAFVGVGAMAITSIIGVATMVYSIVNK